MDAVIAVSFKQMVDGVLTAVSTNRIMGNGWQKFRIAQRRISMSILIKGVELPKNCYECPFAMDYYSTLYAGRRSRFKAAYSCVITHTAITSTKRN